MYHRFLNDSDYKGLITENALYQLVREDGESIEKAEEAAESSMLEYLSENYEVEKALLAGKSIKEYNSQITYPAGAHFYRDGRIWEATRSINGRKSPSDKTYWEEFTGQAEGEPPFYSQLKSYSPGNIVTFANTIYKCLEYNGIDFNNVRVPGLTGWKTTEAYQWVANLEYNEWDVAIWDGEFYALLEKDNVDLTENPYLSDKWGLIAMYNPYYSQYIFSDNEYVFFEEKVYAPAMEVNPDEVGENHNVKKADPRNPNLKKHMARIAIYELYKLITPNNVSQVRITDYEESMKWLRDAAKLRINPQIARKLDEDDSPVTDWQVATFQRDYDPYKNPWQI